MEMAQAAAPQTSQALALGMVPAWVTERALGQGARGTQAWGMAAEAPLPAATAPLRSPA